VNGHVYLVGMPGSGKSAVGWALSDLLGRPFVDLDREIEQAVEMSIAEIFERGGEDGFRDAETDALKAMADRPASVVACGGGVVLRDENRKFLRETGWVAYMAVPLHRLADRVRLGDPSRPLLRHTDDLARLAAEREPLYREVADSVIEGDAEPDDVARRIADGMAA
jgi:shikimate kinase